jgi:prepilin peptidase CpaA
MPPSLPLLSLGTAFGFWVRIALGLILRRLLFGWKGLAGAAMVCLIAGGAMFVVYAERAMGAGDVKLMPAIGSLVGVGHTGVVLLATAICGGLLAIGYAVYGRRVRS